MNTAPASANPIATVFGGTGFIGRHIVMRLAKAGYSVKVATRYPEAAYFLRPYGTVGQIVPFPCNYRDDASLAAAVKNASVVINCIGILFEPRKNIFHLFKRRFTFAQIHTDLAKHIATAAKTAGAARFIHISAIANGDSKYARSKREGESAVRAAFPSASIFRPSVVFGPEDQFFNRFARMAMLPIPLPLIGGGKTKLQPVFVGDVAQAAIHATLCVDAPGRTYDFGGPDVVTFKQVLQRVGAMTGRKSILLPIPFFIAKLMGAVLGILPAPPLTADQVESLKSDSIAANGTFGLKDLQVVPTGMSIVVADYLTPFRKAGVFPAREEYGKPGRSS